MGIDARVESCRKPDIAHDSGTGTEILLLSFGVDAAFDGVTPKLNIALREPQGSAARDLDLLSDKVESDDCCTNRSFPLLLDASL